MPAYHASFYTLRVSHRDATLLFNGMTGALLRLDQDLTKALRPFLGPERARTAGVGYKDWTPPTFLKENLPDAVAPYWSILQDGGVFVESGIDERDIIIEDYRDARSRSPFFITITATLNCNMRCYYCYQNDDALKSLSPETGDHLVTWVTTQIDRQTPRALYVEWYGGEPMLNQGEILRLSRRLTALCDDRGIPYKASMICNGTRWPRDPDPFIRDIRLTRVQISLDGPEPYHNARRGLVNPPTGEPKTDQPRTGQPRTGQPRTGQRRPSFQEIMETISALQGKVSLYIRINVDPMIGWHALDLLEDFQRRGWLDDSSRVYPYVACINALTEHCHFLEDAKPFQNFEDEFAKIQKEFYRNINSRHKTKALERAMYYPTRRIINCAAVNETATIFGPDGLMYKCGLDVGDTNRAHDDLAHALDTPTSDAGEPGDVDRAAERLDPTRWARFDPFHRAQCRECQYLPVCLGGCPKAHIENNTRQIEAHGHFFEQQFAHMISEYYDAVAHLQDPVAEPRAMGGRR